MKRRRRKIYPIIIAVILVFSAVLFVRARLRPYVSSLVEMEGRRAGSAAITKAVVNIFGDEKLTYGDIVNVEYSEGGRIASVRADIAGLNELRVLVCDAVADELALMPPTSVRLSVGSMIGELFSGRGIGIKVGLDSIGTVDVDFSSEFVSAGINQTLHRIKMKVEVSCTMLAATYRVDTLSTCTFNLAETVIVGEVPENYTDIGLMSEDDYENINNYIP